MYLQAGREEQFKALGAESGLGFLPAEFENI